MAIYDKPVRVLIREMAAELTPQKGQLFSKNQANRVGHRYPKIKEGTIAAHLIRFSTNATANVFHAGDGAHHNDPCFAQACMGSKVYTDALQISAKAPSMRAWVNCGLDSELRDLFDRCHQDRCLDS